MTPPQTDERLETVETIQVPFDTFKKALRRNYLDDNRRDRSYVLRLYPPFEPSMQVEYYESEQGRHYSDDWDAKPFHIPPELVLIEGSGGGFSNVPEWPTETTTRNALSEEDLDSEGGIEAAVDTARTVFWQELKHELPDEFDLGAVHGLRGYEVAVEWGGLDE